MKRMYLWAFALMTFIAPAILCPLASEPQKTATNKLKETREYSQNIKPSRLEKTSQTGQIYSLPDDPELSKLFKEVSSQWPWENQSFKNSLEGDIKRYQEGELIEGYHPSYSELISAIIKYAEDLTLASGRNCSTDRVIDALSKRYKNN